MLIDQIPKLTDAQLVAIYKNALTTQDARIEASKHPKFEKMEFPPINPEFIKMRDALKSEIDKRNLVI